MLGMIGIKTGIVEEWRNGMMASTLRLGQRIILR
jgi:hypothetical protein